jgi:4a-hydroxytetrahydrobiopterin dehydratase
MSTRETADARTASDRALTSEELLLRLHELPGWSVEGRNLRHIWTFRDHYQAIAFVNAVAWVSHQTDHHPDIQVGYNRVSVSYSTHSSEGISEKDFICAAKVSALQLK